MLPTPLRTLALLLAALVLSVPAVAAASARHHKAAHHRNAHRRTAARKRPRARIATGHHRRWVKPQPATVTTTTTSRTSTTSPASTTITTTASQTQSQSSTSAATPTQTQTGTTTATTTQSQSQTTSVAAPPVPVISGTTYYVSASGSDNNSGTSPAQAWKTVNQANNATLHPGDGVLFQGGQSFGDSTLMPAQGGTPGHPIVYGSYGTGQATITQGVWFVSQNDLTFDNLKLGPASGLQGGNNSHNVNDIRVQRCTIDFGSGAAQSQVVGINANGNNWTIAGNVIQNIGNSGLLLLGDNYNVTGNTITSTGLNASIPYGMHGIYLKASNSTVAQNTITHFSADGISVRYRNSTVTHNTISTGGIGIAWFQYDTVAGTSHWTDNTITNTTDAGIYVSPTDQAGATIESFAITGNTIHTAGQALNLHHSRGRYTTTGNQTR